MKTINHEIVEYQDKTPPVGEKQLSVDYPTSMLEAGTFKLGSVQRRQLRNIGLNKNMTPQEAIDYAINFARYWNKFLFNMPLERKWAVESHMREGAEIALCPPYSEPKTIQDDPSVIDVEEVVDKQLKEG